MRNRNQGYQGEDDRNQGRNMDWQRSERGGDWQSREGGRGQQYGQPDDDDERGRYEGQWRAGYQGRDMGGDRDRGRSDIGRGQYGGNDERYGRQYYGQPEQMGGTWEDEYQSRRGQQWQGGGGYGSNRGDMGRGYGMSGGNYGGGGYGNERGGNYGGGGYGNDRGGNFGGGGYGNERGGYGMQGGGYGNERGGYGMQGGGFDSQRGGMQRGGYGMQGGGLQGGGLTGGDGGYMGGLSRGGDSWRSGGMAGRGGENMWRGQESFRGKGPKGFTRSDERIKECVCDELEDADEIDASDIEVTVRNGEVTLSGQVDGRQAKRLAEDIVCSVRGVKECNNQLRTSGSQSSQQQKSGQQQDASASNGNGNVRRTEITR
jgi:hypothetical protein